MRLGKFGSEANGCTSNCETIIAMKQYWPQAVWFCGGAILGQFTQSTLFPLWANLGLLIPIARWIASSGSENLNWCWLVVYIWLVSWLVVALVSVIGGLFIKRRLFLDMLLFGTGFTFVPLALHSYLFSSVPSFADYVQHVVIIGIAVFGGFLGSKRATRNPATSRRRLLGSADG